MVEGLAFCGFRTQHEKIRDMKKLLIFSDWYEPGYLAGGPIRSLQNLVRSLGDKMEVDVFTSNRDFSATENYPLEANTWLKRNGARVFYCDAKAYSRGLVKKLLKEKKYDVLYFNSLYSKNYTLLPLFLARRLGYQPEQLVLAPRGMLGKGALQLKSNKKKLFLSISRKIGLFKGITWHATSEQEAQEIRTNFDANITPFLAANIPGPSTLDGPKALCGGKIRMIFLSRLSPKKNLKFALECVARYSDKAKFRFDLYGTPEDKQYLQEILDLAKQKELDLAYHGSVAHHEVSECLRNADFLILPTLNENYGHVIFESLAVGTPVLISDQTPWRDLQAKGIGYDIPLDPNIWKKVLGEILRINPEEYRLMSEKSIAYAQSKVEAIDIGAYLRMFKVEA